MYRDQRYNNNGFGNRNMQQQFEMQDFHSNNSSFPNQSMINSNNYPDHQQEQQRCSKRKRIITAGIIGAVVIIAVTVALIVVFTRGEQPVQSASSTVCTGQTCNGVRAQVSNFITQTFTNQNDRNAMIKVAQNMQSVENATDAEIDQIFYQQFLAAQCAEYTLGTQSSSNIQDLQDIQFDTAQRLEKYLDFLEKTQQNTFRLMTDEQLAIECPTINDAATTRRLQTDNCSQSSSQVVLYYVNGVTYTADEAAKNLRAIRAASQAAGMVFNGFQIGSGRLQLGWKDFLLVYDQKNEQKQSLNQTMTPISQKIKLMIIKSLIRGNLFEKQSVIGITRQVAEEVYVWFIQWASQSMIDFIDDPPERQAQLQHNVNSYVNDIKEDIQEGKSVMIVAHSQGTLYGNQIYKALSLQQREYARFIYVGGAAGSMADGSSRWVTNPNDWVINSLRAVSSSMRWVQPLPANVASASFSNGNHNFLGYVNNYPQIVNHMIEANNTFPPPPTQTLGSGPITVRLIWDEQRDVDLHVYQPNGTHVFYANRNGSVGYLDLDDVTSYGPEHYYADCDRMQAGTYTVKVHLFSGSGPSNVNVRVNAGNIIRNRNITLAYPPTGYEDVFQINVQQISTGKFTYQVSQL